MKTLRRGRPSPALVVALIALIAATAGVGYAATKISGSQLENASVSGKKLKKSTIKSKQLKDGGVKAKDIAGGVLPDSFSFHDSAVVEPLASNESDTFTTVGSVTGLPAGSYLIIGKAQVEPVPLGGSDTAVVRCRITVNGVEIDRSMLQVGENAASNSVVLRGPISVQGATTVSDGASAALECNSSGIDIEIGAEERALSALRVGA